MKWIHFAVLSSLTFSLLSCGDSGGSSLRRQTTFQNWQPTETNMTIWFRYSAEIQNIIDQSGTDETSIRVFYTHNEIKPEAVVQPLMATPLLVNKDGTMVPDWSTSKAQGLLLPFNSRIEIFRLPLDKTGMEIMVELLQKYRDTDIYRVIGYLCIDGPTNAPYTLAQVERDENTRFLIQKGRTCGSCAKIEEPADPNISCIK